MASTDLKGGPSVWGFAVTPDDGANLATPVRALRVGGAGNVTFTDGRGATQVFTGAIAGEIIYCRMSKVAATGTTATNLFGYV